MPAWKQNVAHDPFSVGTPTALPSPAHDSLALDGLSGVIIGQCPEAGIRHGGRTSHSKHWLFILSGLLMPTVRR